MVVTEPRTVTDDGEIPFRAPVAGVDPTDDAHLITKGWAEANLGGGGGGAPTTVDYLVKTASGSLSAERVVTDSIYITANWGTTGQVSFEIGAAVYGYLASTYAAISHTHAAADVTSGVLDVARLGTGSPSSSTYLRGDGVWSATSAFAAASHTHAASDIASGTIATARLGSGTASSTTFLRGDQSYSTIPTGAIADAAVTDAKLRNSAALSLIGRSANSSGTPADIAAASDHQVMRRSGTAIAFGAVNLAQSAAVTGALPIANGGTGSTSASAARTALGVAATSHDHEARFVFVDTSGFVGYLAGAAGAETMSVQELFEYIDSNGLTPP